MKAPQIRIVTDDDRRWLYDGKERQWCLPEAAAWYWRLWGVRHLRATMATNRVNDWDTRWRGLGLFPTGYDRWVIYAIRRGWI